MTKVAGFPKLEHTTLFKMAGVVLIDQTKDAFSFPRARDVSKNNKNSDVKVLFFCTYALLSKFVELKNLQFFFALHIFDINCCLYPLNYALYPLLAKNTRYKNQ